MWSKSQRVGCCSGQNARAVRAQSADSMRNRTGPTKEKEELKRRKAENSEARAALEEMCQNFGQQYDEVSVSRHNLSSLECFCFKHLS